MDDYKGNVARLLKSIWISDGVVSSAAFNLRPQIHETYISVLRSEAESFFKNHTQDYSSLSTDNDW